MQSMDQAAVWFAVLVVLGDKGFSILDFSTIDFLETDPGETEPVEFEIGANKDSELVVLVAMGKLPDISETENHANEPKWTFSDYEPVSLAKVLELFM